MSLWIYPVNKKHSPNTGVCCSLSSRGHFAESCSEMLLNSLLTALMASGFVNRKPNSQNAAGPTLPWPQMKIDMKAMTVSSLSDSSQRDCTGSNYVIGEENITHYMTALIIFSHSRVVHTKGNQHLSVQLNPFLCLYDRKPHSGYCQEVSAVMAYFKRKYIRHQTETQYGVFEGTLACPWPSLCVCT